MILTSIASLPFPPFACAVKATFEVLLALPHVPTGNVWEGAPDNVAVPLSAGVPVVFPDLAVDIHLHLLTVRTLYLVFTVSWGVSTIWDSNMTLIISNIYANIYILNYLYSEVLQLHIHLQCRLERKSHRCILRNSPRYPIPL